MPNNSYPELRLERLLKEKQATMSTKMAIEIAQSIFEIELETPTTKQKINKILLLTDEQKYLSRLFHFG